MYRKTTLAAFFAALALWAGAARAAPPATITYGGLLTTSGGAPVTTATDITFAFYASPTGGSALASELHTVTPGADGFFSQIVGASIGSFALVFEQQIYMGITIQGESEMTPRIPITSVPSALAVDFSGISGWPNQACPGATPFATGLDATGHVTCGGGTTEVQTRVAGSCPSGQYVRVISNDGSVTCGTDAGGTITEVTASTGLSGGGATGAVTLSVNPAAVQTRVSGSCPAGSSIRIIAQDGTVTCQTDANSITSVEVTAPLTNTGTAAAPVVAISGVSCPNPSILRWNGSAWSCSAFTKTVLTFSGQTDDAAPSSTAKQLRVIGTFTKASAGTSIEIVWNSHVSGNGYCSFHIRVDGTASPAADLGPVIYGTGYYPVSTTNVFTGLAAGAHTIAIWDRAVAATLCSDNPGNYLKNVVVTEF